MHFKDLPKEQWLPMHYDWWVGEAEKMVALSRERGRMTQADEWQVIAEKRQAERVIIQDG
jgi:hypothetical protein